MTNIILLEKIEDKIYLIKGKKVMLDSDLARLYGVETRSLNQAVKRNKERFPEDFMLQLSESEFERLRPQFVTSNEEYSGNSLSLRSQFVTLKKARGQHRKYLPYVFSEHGVAMLSSVLKSEKAIQVNIAIIRTFIKLRDFALNYKALADKINELERRLGRHDKKIAEIFVVLRLLAKEESKKPLKEIGFKA